MRATPCCLLALVLLGCRRDRAPAGRRAAPAPVLSGEVALVSVPSAAESVAGVAGVAVSQARPARSAPAPAASAPLSAAEQATARTYLAALGRGRALTTRRIYPEAVKAFDEALTAWPGDARALSERGYARLEAGDTDGAERDFYATLAHSPDRAVLAAATFNLALVAERRGQPDRARELKDAARTNRAPGPPADRCRAEFQHRSLLSTETKQLQTLRQVRSALVAYLADRSQTPATPLPTTDEEAGLKQELLGGGEGPWHLAVGEDNHLLFGQPLAYTLVLGIPGSIGFRCGSIYLERLDLSGNPSILFLGSNSSVGLHCSKADPGVEDVGNDCQTFCRDDRFMIADLTVFDRQTGKQLLTISQESRRARDSSELASFVPREGGVQILGGGCNRFEPFDH